MLPDRAGTQSSVAMYIVRMDHSLLDSEQERHILERIAAADSFHGSSAHKNHSDSYATHVERRFRMATRGTLDSRTSVTLGPGLVSLAVEGDRRLRKAIHRGGTEKPAKKTTRQKPYTQKGRKPKSLDHHGHMRSSRAA